MIYVPISAWWNFISQSPSIYRVFTHTPRDEFKTLLEGRNQYSAKTHKLKKYEINGTSIGNVKPDGTLREGYVLEDEAIQRYT